MNPGIRIIKKNLLIALLVGICILSAASASAAGLIPDCGPGGCNLCDIWPLADKIINLLLFVLAIPVLTVMIIWGGVLWTTAGASPGNIEQGKKIIQSAIIGIIIAFSGWLIVDTIIKSLASGSVVGAWQAFPDKASCENPNLANEQITFQDVVSGGNSFGGSCTVAPASSPASPEKLAATCMSRNADAASKIANQESHGDPTIPSGPDRCQADGTDDSVSWGLFQINISANTLPGLDCPSAFNMPYTGASKKPLCKVIDRSLYNQCVAAAKNPAINTLKACSLSGNGTRWSAWGANSICRL